MRWVRLSTQEEEENLTQRRKGSEEVKDTDRAPQRRAGLSRRRLCEGGRGVAFRVVSFGGCRRRELLQLPHLDRRDARAQRLFNPLEY
jgi:hypothetical protein